MGTEIISLPTKTYVKSMSIEIKEIFYNLDTKGNVYNLKITDTDGDMFRIRPMEGIDLFALLGGDFSKSYEVNLVDMQVSNVATDEGTLSPEIASINPISISRIIHPPICLYCSNELSLGGFNNVVCSNLLCRGRKLARLIYFLSANGIFGDVLDTKGFLKLVTKNNLYGLTISNMIFTLLNVTDTKYEAQQEELKILLFKLKNAVSKINIKGEFTDCLEIAHFMTTYGLPNITSEDINNSIDLALAQQNGHDVFVMIGELMYEKISDRTVADFYYQDLEFMGNILLEQMVSNRDVDNWL